MRVLAGARYSTFGLLFHFRCLPATGTCKYFHYNLTYVQGKKKGWWCQQFLFSLSSSKPTWPTARSQRVRIILKAVRDNSWEFQLFGSRLWAPTATMLIYEKTTASALFQGFKAGSQKTWTHAKEPIRKRFFRQVIWDHLRPPFFVFFM